MEASESVDGSPPMTTVADVDQDRISNLPDALRHHILSFLDMVYVARTSVLSRKWRNFWTSLPFLNLNLMAYIIASKVGRSGFVRFVNRVLLFHKDTNIQTLRLSYMLNCLIKDNVDTWIHAAVSRNVKVLDLELFGDGFETPETRYLFTCKSLTTLKLWMKDEQPPVFDFSEPVSLPSLKNLHLRSIRFNGEQFSSFISKCPVLETLIISDCLLVGETNELVISCPQLKELVVNITHDTKTPPDYSKIKVVAPNLTSFRCIHHKNMNAYCIVDVSSLVNSEIELARPYNEIPPWTVDDYGKFILFLRRISYGKSLTLSLPAWLLKTLLQVFAAMESEFFSTLRFLKLKAWDSPFSIQSVMYLLENSPNVETFELDMTKHPLRKREISDLANDVDTWKPELKWVCMRHHLKFVKITGILGYPYELDFLKFLLKKALVLEKMTIVTSEKQTRACRRRVKKFKKKLVSDPNASASTQVLFF